MSNTFPDLVYPAQQVYHAVYGSHDGGYDPHGDRWKYWLLCDGKSAREPFSKSDLVHISHASGLGLRDCQRVGCKLAIKRIRNKTLERAQEAMAEGEVETVVEIIQADAAQFATMLGHRSCDTCKGKGADHE